MKIEKQGKFWIIKPLETNEYDGFVIEKYYDGYGSLPNGYNGYWQEMIRTHVEFDSEDTDLQSLWEFLYAVDVFDGNYYEFRDYLKRMLEKEESL